MCLENQQEQTEHRECFGRMFPETLHSMHDKRESGKAFSILVSSAGGMGVADRKAIVEHSAWDDCNKCPEFENCYRLSHSLLALETAAARI